MFRISLALSRSRSLSLWRCGPTRAMASSFMRFLDHTQRRTTVGRTPLDEWSARRRDLYLITHNTWNRQTSMPPVGFDPTVSAGERPQTYALDRAATGTGTVSNQQCHISILLVPHMQGGGCTTAVAKTKCGFALSLHPTHFMKTGIFGNCGHCYCTDSFQTFNEVVYHTEIVLRGS